MYVGAIYDFGPRSSHQLLVEKKVSPSIIMMKCILIILILLTASAAALPNEANGVVTQIFGGATFAVSGIGCVRLADVVDLPAGTLGGLNGREFTRDHLMGTQVFLDIDNRTGKDESGCLLCLVYMAYPNGTPDLHAVYNKIYTDAGYGRTRDDPTTEFNPQDWASSG